jgi:catabolite regulation protein CreA
MKKLLFTILIMAVLSVVSNADIVTSTFTALNLTVVNTRCAIVGIYIVNPSTYNVMCYVSDNSSATLKTQFLVKAGDNYNLPVARQIGIATRLKIMSRNWHTAEDVEDPYLYNHNFKITVYYESY